MKISKSLNSGLIAIAAMAAAQLPAPASAAGYTIPDVPLIVAIESIPNVFFQLDDSGSMNWEILALPHWSACAYDGFWQENSIVNNAGGVGVFTGGDTAGREKSYCQTPQDDRAEGDARMIMWERRRGNNRIRRDGEFIFNFSSSEGCNNSGIVERCEDDITRQGTNSTAGELDMDWRIRSHDLNITYFNPNVRYEPWVGSSTDYEDASFTNARSWPDSNEGDYNQTKNLNGFWYNVWVDDKHYSGTKPVRNNMTEDPGRGSVDLWDSYVKVVVPSSGAPVCTKYSVTRARVRGMDASKETVSCSPYLGGQGADSLRQNIANWFQYHRRRVHVSNYAVGRVMTALDEFRYGLGFINNNRVEIQMPSAGVTDFDSHINSILNNLYRDKEAGGNTPLRGGLKLAGDYYAGNLSVSSPITESCQKNFTILTTDGYWDDETNRDDDDDLLPVTDTTGDNDGALIYGNQNLQGTTLADVASYYYNNDLSDLDDAVPTDAFDTAAYQHMVTYTINFGSQGLLRDTDGDGWPGSGDLPDNFDWYSNAVIENEGTSYWDPRKADDMWHAAWNGKGLFVSADSPTELVEAMLAALSNIAQRIGGAASAAANSGSISSNSQIFQAKFDTSDWHGELLAFPVNDDGTLAAAATWNSNTLLSARNDLATNGTGKRDVYTWNNDGTFPTGTAFNWGNISESQQIALGKAPDGSPDELGPDRLLYIRGVSSKEQRFDGPFRNRSNKLGDIVNSDPIYVGFPPFFYSFGNYQAFFNSNKNRKGVIYFGANDGMFHAIDETNGEALFSYVPDKIIPKLYQLSDPEYDHDFFVDGPPAYGDVQLTNGWRSVVASGLRSGGQGVFALDVTSPDSFSASNVLWEFTDEDDADLGYTFSEPQIKLMANGKWAVIIGNGLNNTEADGNASTSGAASLFILFIEDGKDGWTSGDWIKIPVPGGDASNPNALFTPAAADLDGDTKVDAVYAGDRFGKVWKFDVSSGSTGSWGLAAGNSPFFDAGAGRPVTDRPAVAAHPLGRSLGQLVTFGTGSYIENADNTAAGQPVQSIFAVWDFSDTYATAKGLTSASARYGHSRDDMFSSSMTVDSGVRVITGDSEVSWLDENGAPDDLGWYVDLPVSGERMIRRPVLRDNLVFFVSMIPNTDPCAAGGTGWIMVLDSATGRPPIFPVFDVDGDLDVTRENDLIEAGEEDDDTDNLVPVGISSPSIPNLPALIYDDRPGFNSTGAPFPPAPNSVRGCDAGSARAYTFTTGSNGSILAIETATEILSCGRQSWRGER